MLAIRMRREGAKRKPYFRMVVTEGRTPRDGKFLESLGTYDAMETTRFVQVYRSMASASVSALARVATLTRQP